MEKRWSLSIQMAGLFPSMAMKWACDKLSALLPANLKSSPAAPSSSAGSLLDLENVRLLGRTMRSIQKTLNDVDEHCNIREESARLRLRELKELAYDAQDVGEEYEYEVNRRKVELEALEQTSGVGEKRKRQEVHGGFLKKKVHGGAHCTEAGIAAVPYELSDRVREVVDRFNEIKEYYVIFNLSDNDGERRVVSDICSVRERGSFVFAESILGRERDKEKVIEMLMPGEGSCDGGRMSVLAIVGMGGLGKTTLAQLVYNDPKMRQSFDVFVWVCVTENFDVKSLTQKIIASVTKESCTLQKLDDLQEMLAEEIMGKVVLLVFDDVWNEQRDRWDLLCKPLSAAKQCKILVTTRDEAVERSMQTMSLMIYPLGFLRRDESWSLFEQTVVGQGNVIQGNLVEIAQKIVAKCTGLPLAIKTLASMLRYETDEMRWRYEGKGREFRHSIKEEEKNRYKRETRRLTTKHTPNQQGQPSKNSKTRGACTTASKAGHNRQQRQPPRDAQNTNTTTDATAAEQRNN